MEAKIGRQLVRCNVQYLDQYGRAVASCAVNGDDLGEWMVRRGEAVAYREYSQDYIKEEEEAARTGRGIWAGSFEVPKEWRRRNNGSKDGGPAVASGGGIVALPQAARLPGCDIKGNISSSGERIYHTPEVRSADSTVPEPGAWCGG